jgi:hypothetical protein
LMAASSPEGESLVWKTTPNEPLPTILHWVYCKSRVSPVTPSCTFSRMTSAKKGEKDEVSPRNESVSHIGGFLPPILRLCKAFGRDMLLLSSSGASDRYSLCYLRASWAERRMR